MDQSQERGPLELITLMRHPTAWKSFVEKMLMVDTPPPRMNFTLSNGMKFTVHNRGNGIYELVVDTDQEKQNE